MAEARDLTGSFSQRVDTARDRGGVDVLANEGIAAHRASAELQEIARSNTPAGLHTMARADRRRRVDAVILGLIVVLGLVWLADNVVGYAVSSEQALTVSSTGLGRATVDLADGSSDRADCWASDGVERVWKAAPPFGSLVPYRCGAGALAVVPGPMSALAVGVAIIAAWLLGAGRRRHLRAAWY